jgi:anhydro-N-acetylmuramic acid kinase
MTELVAIGLMSGTSLDGIDAAIIKTDGDRRIEIGPALFVPYSRASKVFARRAIKAALEGRDRAAEIAEAEAHLTRANAEAVAQLLAEAGAEARDIDVIGYHGQTILHRPKRNPESVGRTWQIGDGEKLAALCGVDVVHDFRADDVAAGGEGAPLSPVYHAARVAALGRTGPIAVINIGGVSNLTYVAPGAADEDLLSFDCGPGNGLIDEWMALKTGRAMDEDGAAASAGAAHEETVRLMLLHPFIRREPPKSADRYDFRLDTQASFSVEDGAATLAAVTARAIAGSVRFLDAPPAAWIVAGGGRRNGAILAALRGQCAAPVLLAEEVGWRGDFLEAECFAYLAVRSLAGAPITFPRTTRAPRPLTGGRCSRAPK